MTEENNIYKNIITNVACVSQEDKDGFEDDFLKYGMSFYKNIDGELKHAPLNEIYLCCDQEEKE